MDTIEYMGTKPAHNKAAARDARGGPAVRGRRRFCALTGRQQTGPVGAREPHAVRRFMSSYLDRFNAQYAS